MKMIDFNQCKLISGGSESVDLPIELTTAQTIGHTVGTVVGGVMGVALSLPLMLIVVVSGSGSGGNPFHRYCFEKNMSDAIGSLINTSAAIGAQIGEKIAG